MSASSDPTHLLLYPHPASGHIIPMLDFAYALLRRSCRFTITIIVTSPNLPLLQPLLSIFPSSLNSVTLQPPLESPPAEQRLVSKMIALRVLDGQIEDWFTSHHSPPVAIVADFLLGWTCRLASKLKIKHLVFSPSGAFAVAVANSIWQRPVSDGLPSDEEMPFTFKDLPDSPVFKWWQLSKLYRSYTPDDHDWQFLKASWLENLTSWGVVVNTFADLEDKYIKHLKEKDYKNPNRVWAVGPLLLVTDDPLASERGGASTVPSAKVLTWLDQRPENTVVFVCFGSRSALTRKQIEILTTALDRSRLSFILCFRQSIPVDDQGELPEGYEDSVAGRGLVIRGWAPQLSILKHRAVGAFLTHCGWNSTLEGLSAGVVMLTWPMSGDQFTNAELLVEQVGVGIRVGESTHWIPEVDELVGLLTNAMSPTRMERKRALEIASAAGTAAAKYGSSDNDLDNLVTQLSQLA